YYYSDRGRNYDFEGQNNSYLTGGFPVADPDGNSLASPGTPLAGGAPSIPDVAEAPGGHLWDVARAAGGSYRNYRVFYSLRLTISGLVIFPNNYPASRGIQPAGHDLAGVSDFDYRRYDNDYPDSDAPSMHNCSYSRTDYGKYHMPSRFSEWNREFQE